MPLCEYLLRKHKIEVKNVIFESFRRIDSDRAIKHFIFLGFLIVDIFTEVYRLLTKTSQKRNHYLSEGRYIANTKLQLHKKTSQEIQ